MTMKSRIAFKICIVSFLWGSLYAVGITQDPRDEFYNHVVVQPTLYQASLYQRDSLYLKDANKEEETKLEFTAFGRNFILNLKENKELFSPNFKEMYQANGKFVAYEPANERERRCYYQGHMPNVEGSWAAISTCNGISGVISDGKETYYIEPNPVSENVEHLMFKASDYKQQNFKCGVKDDDIFSMQNRFLKRQKVQNLEDPYKSNSDSRYIEVVIVNDNSMYQKYNQDLQKIYDRTRQLANVASSLLSTLNTFLALQNIYVWSQSDSINITSDAEATLIRFLEHRKNYINKNDPNDNAILITNLRYDKGVAGNAYVGRICTDNKSGENILDTSSVVSLVAAATAHELGHNLGMNHDNPKYCTCQEQFCVMHPYTLPSLPHYWSSCSKSDIEYTYSSGKDRCLKNKPTKVSGPSCGNGYLESGEECDCGIKEFCDDTCCDATTCRKIQSNACF